MLVFKAKIERTPQMGGRKQALPISQPRLLRSTRLGRGIPPWPGAGQLHDKPDTHWVLIEDKQGLCGCIRLLQLPPRITCCPASSPPPSLAKPAAAATTCGADPPRHRRRPGPRLENGIGQNSPASSSASAGASPGSRGSASWWPWSACRWWASSAASPAHRAPQPSPGGWICGGRARGRYPLPPGRAFRPRRPSPCRGHYRPAGMHCLAVI